MAGRGALLCAVVVFWTVMALSGWPLGEPPTPWRSLAVAQEEPTIIVEPTAVPQPAYLPALLRDHDPKLPGALTTRLEGYVVKLTVEGRQACAPATHVLQSKREGFPGAVAHAVLHSPHPEPELTLDLYVGEYVEVFGFSSLAPAACDSLSWQHLRVEAIRRIILPPGGQARR